ncbi:MAG: hypothetical protein ABWX82_07950 [Leifsonia sp.]
MARTARSTPAELNPGWPDAVGSDAVGEVARLFAGNLRAAIGERSVRSVGLASGVNHATILGILEGRAWPDLSTIAKLEIGLGADLWPRRG